MSDWLFAVEGLDKRFGDRVLFKDASLGLEAGSGYVLVGPNGSGKTTLLRIVAGLEPADGGRMALRAQSVRAPDYPESWRRDIVYVHQQPYLFRTSLQENLGYGLARRGLPPDDRRARVHDALKWAGLTASSKVPPDKLSSGEKQRVALARARVLGPTILLLDEPTANLDGVARKQVLGLLTELCIDNHTVVIASHDPEIIRLAILNRVRVSGQRITVDE